MIRKMMLAALLLLSASALRAQSELEKLMEVGSDQDRTLLITDSAYRHFLYGRFDAISGTEVKKGKLFGNSATIDEKSVTLNVSFRPLWKTLYLQPTASATPKKGFVSIFEDKELSSTVGLGLNFQWFTSKNFSGFYPSSRIRLHNELRAAKYRFFAFQKKELVGWVSKNLTDLRTIVSNAQSNGDLQILLKRFHLQSIEVIEVGGIDTLLTQKTRYRELIDTLTSSKILPKRFSSLYFAAQRKLLDSLIAEKPDSVAKGLVEKRYLSKMDSLQFGAPFNSTTVMWFSGGFGYNHERQDVIAEGNSKIVRAARNEYIRLSLAFNVLRTAANSNRNYISLGISYANGRDYREKLKKTANQVEAMTASGVPLEKIVKSYTFFETVRPRVDMPGVEASYLWYYGKKNVGLDFGIRGSLNDVDDDNLGGRFGVIIPVGEKDKKPVLIEPLVRLQKLSAKIDDFWKDNFVVGFNVSVKLGKAIL